jgi:hypothetical protein
VRQNLLKKVARDFIPRTVPARESAEILRPADVPSRALRELDELVAEYGRIRATMSSGDERTEKMTIVMAQIKAIAPLIASRLSMLSQSSVAGERLAAIAILGWEPSTKYLRWLAARLDRSSEKPFIGYYAGLALLVAARTLDSDALPAVAHAVNEGLGLLAASSGGRNISGLDRYRVLQNALYELNRRTT